MTENFLVSEIINQCEQKSCYHLTHCNVQFKGPADAVSTFQFWAGDELFEAAVYIYDLSDMETGLFLP